MISLDNLQDIIPNIVHFAPDRVLCSFLLVTPKMRQLALVECKRRSKLPHLWDIPKDDLVIKLDQHHSLSTVIHIDYCLCAYLGHVSHNGIYHSMSVDLINLAQRMGESLTSHIYARAAQLGLDDVWDALPDHTIKTNSDFNSSISLHIAGKNTRSHKVAKMVRERDIRSLQKMPYSTLPIALCNLLTAWLIQRDDLEIVKILVDKIPRFLTLLRQEAALFIIPGKIAKYYNIENCYVWRAQDINHGSYVLCVDDPNILSCTHDLQKKYSIIHIAEKSCCWKLLESVGKTIEVSSYLCNNLSWIFSWSNTAGKSVRIAAIRKASMHALRDFLDSPAGMEIVLDIIPGAKQFLTNFYMTIIAKYQEELKKL